MTTQTVRLAIVGTGGMARMHAEAYTKMDGVHLVAAVDVNVDNLTKFCTDFNIPHRFSSVEDAIAWGAFDAVSNVTPDKFHYETTLPLLRANKHVLCEKPLATHYAHAQEMADLANAQGVCNAVNLTYRQGSALQHAHKMVKQGVLGKIRHFEASYLQSWLSQPAWGQWRTEDQWLWRLSTAHGSKGTLGDIGVHILDFLSYVANSDIIPLSCVLKTYDKAENNRIGSYVLDANDSFIMTVALDANSPFGDGAVGTVTATRFAAGHHNDLSLRIYGQYGALEVTDRMFEVKLRACIGMENMTNATWEDIPCEDVLTNYQGFIASIRGEQNNVPDFNRGAVLQKVLDATENMARS